MFNFFNFKKENTNFSEEENEEDLVFSKPIASQIWNDKLVNYYFLSVKDVAPHLSSWCFNRSINQTHKNSIKTSLISQPAPHLMGTIQIVRDKNNNCRVINGQHRLKAIQEI